VRFGQGYRTDAREVNDAVGFCCLEQGACRVEVADVAAVELGRESRRRVGPVETEDGLPGRREMSGEVPADEPLDAGDE